MFCRSKNLVALLTISGTNCKTNVVACDLFTVRENVDILTL
jgi:hypothetical protein